MEVEKGLSKLRILTDDRRRSLARLAAGSRSAREQGHRGHGVDHQPPGDHSRRQRRPIRERAYSLLADNLTSEIALGEVAIFTHSSVTVLEATDTAVSLDRQLLR